MAVINLRELLVRDVLVKVKASFLTVLESEGVRNNVRHKSGCRMLR